MHTVVAFSIVPRASEPSGLVENRLQRCRYLAHTNTCAACASREARDVQILLRGVVVVLHQPRAISASSVEWLSLTVLETAYRIVRCVATSCLASANFKICLCRTKGSVCVSHGSERCCFESNLRMRNPSWSERSHVALRYVYFSPGVAEQRRRGPFEDPRFAWL